MRQPLLSRFLSYKVNVYKNSLCTLLRLTRLAFCECVIWSLGLNFDPTQPTKRTTENERRLTHAYLISQTSSSIPIFTMCNHNSVYFLEPRVKQKKRESAGGISIVWRVQIPPTPFPHHLWKNTRRVRADDVSCQVAVLRIFAS